jgi:hypothetical protein
MDILVGGTVEHQTTNSGKITIGTPARGGEVYFTFNPADFDSQKARAENAIRLLEYAKYLYSNPENVPPIQVRSQGASAKVG